ncbi:AtpZ/AtpI family protein [Myxococcota bacterium]|nr:AtpZ/AtpI family protein [Myxococcota bacterium]
MVGSSGRRPTTSRSSLGPAYQGAVEAGLAIVISVGFGLWADTRFDTSPVGLLVGLAIGMGAFALRITRLLRGMNGAPPGPSGSDSGREREQEREGNGPTR